MKPSGNADSTSCRTRLKKKGLSAILCHTFPEAFVRRHELHEKMRQINELRSRKQRRTRGPDAQQPKREMERSVRIDALAFAGWTQRLGYRTEQSAYMLSLKSGTL